MTADALPTKWPFLHLAVESSVRKVSRTRPEFLPLCHATRLEMCWIQKDWSFSCDPCNCPLSTT